MPIAVTCQHCQHHTKAPDAAAGRRAKCPKCGETIIIPAAAQVVLPAMPKVAAAPPPIGMRPPLPAGSSQEIIVEVVPDVMRDLVPQSEPRVLKKCPFCAELIAAEAVKCKHCGEMLDPRLRPAPAGPDAAPDRKVQTVEATGKKWKLLQGAGVLMLIAGLTFIAIGIAAVNPPIGIFGTLIISVGLPVLLVGRVGAWWYHG